ncbi:30S ribosomal protein S13 [bacterium]|nr:30S ribosomal protein S13 [bacterium]MCK5398392.1 30S ribosomal protein S13 [bacterium]MCK5598422.1 30S ribosomal protein S13 [bacterium]
MARIVGVDIPKNKKVTIGLTYLFGIGLTSAKKIVAESGIDPEKRIKDLDEKEVQKIRKIIEGKYKVEGDLRTEVQMNIRRLKDIGCYRGIRHIRNMPLRGQNTQSNARSHKGPRPPIGGRKK